MLATAAQAGGRVPLSADMQSGFLWRGVEIRNPFGRE
jgi:predicted nucleic acid-binding protein